MSEISIVTAFFDIGRNNWTQENGHPWYLHKTTDGYFEQFGHMASLENEIVVYTQPDLVDRVWSYRRSKEDRTKVYSLDLRDKFQYKLEQIAKVQNDPKFKQLINPIQLRNPEYWSPEYVLVNFLKSWFVNDAINQQSVHNNLAAWMDFGYVRRHEYLWGTNKWMFNFNENKIHVFKLRDYDIVDTKILDIISTNVTYIMGGVIVAHCKLWPLMNGLITNAYETLINKGLVDDDQTLLLISSLTAPNLFEQHQIDENSMFIHLRDFNQKA